jgi:predicted metal-dependent RNase
MNGFSAHADQKGVVDFIAESRQGGRLKNVFLVHGEPGPQRVLSRLLRDPGDVVVNAPHPGDRVRV